MGGDSPSPRRLQQRLVPTSNPRASKRLPSLENTGIQEGSDWLGLGHVPTRGLGGWGRDLLQRKGGGLLPKEGRDAESEKPTDVRPSAID